MRLKHQLMIQSLSPLMLLIIIRNWEFVTEIQGVKLTCKEFVCHNAVLIVVMLFCLVWLIVAIVCFISFGAFRWSEKETGFSIQNVVEDKQASLDYVLTIIVPLLVSDIGTLRGALTFFLLLLLICALLNNTNLFYANPILALLGYHLYTFSFSENQEYGNRTLVGLCKGRINDIKSCEDQRSIEYKCIATDVLYIKER